MASDLTTNPATPPCVPPSLRRLLGDPLEVDSLTPWTPGPLSETEQRIAKEAAGRYSIWLQPTSDAWIQEQLTVLAHVFWAGEDKTAWAVKLRVYPAVLRPYPQDLLAKAFKDGLAIWKWFPKPAEIVGQVDDELRRRRAELRRLRQIAMAQVKRVDAVVTPEQQAAIERGLKNLKEWMSLIKRTYQGPWPTPAQFQSDEQYQAFVRNMHEMGEAA